MELTQRAAKEWLLRLAESRSTTPTGLARRAGLNASTVSRPLASTDGKHTLTRHTLERIASAWHSPAPESVLRDLPDGRNRQTRSKVIAAIGALPPPPLGPNDVPVWGAVTLTKPGFFHLNRVALDYARRPAGGAGVAGLACLRAPDDTMEPWRMTGEAIYLDPNRPIGILDHALVEVSDEANPNDTPLAFIGQLTRDGWYQHKPRKVLDLRGLRVVERFRVLEWEELLA